MHTLIGYQLWFFVDNIYVSGFVLRGYLQMEFSFMDKISLKFFDVELL